MKKQLMYTLAAIMTCGSMNVNAQRQVDYESKHEIGISIGAGCNSSIIDDLDDATVIDVTGGLVKYDNAKRIGGISVEYFYRLRPAIAVGGIFGYSHQKKDALVSNSKVGDCHMNYFTVMPAVKFDWLRRSHFGMYSKLALGMTIRHEKQELGGRDDYKETDVFFNWQASILGIEAGSRQVRGFVELGCGEQGIALAGIRCKF